MKPIELLDLAKEVSGLDTDYKVAKMIEEDRARMTEIRNGKSAPVRVVAKLSTLAGLDPWQTIKEIEAETAKNPKVKAYWEGLARAAVFLAAVTPFFATPTPSEASNGAAWQANAVYYVKWCHKMMASKIKRQLQRLAALFMQPSYPVLPLRIGKA